jgi:hypothetical protein
MAYATKRTGFPLKTTSAWLWRAGNDYAGVLRLWLSKADKETAALQSRSFWRQERRKDFFLGLADFIPIPWEMMRRISFKQRNSFMPCLGLQKFILNFIPHIGCKEVPPCMERETPRRRLI